MMSLVLAFVAFVLLAALAYWLLHPALTLTKATPAREISLSFIDENGKKVLLPIMKRGDKPTKHISIGNNLI
jgi:hypothetical protein